MLLAAGLILMQASEYQIVTTDLTLDPTVTYSKPLLVQASNITIEGNGATLTGPGQGEDLDTFKGTAIRLNGVSSVTIKNVKAKGWEIGLHASNSQALNVEACDFSDNYHNPMHGWGELPSRGGILLESVRHSTFRNNRANRVWDALHLRKSDGNVFENNDFSRTSNTCAKLWTSSRNVFRQNNLSYGIRKDPGEVHARDSTSVLMESGSDDNLFERNDITHGGDGIFIRVLNGWISTGNVFIENDTSYANNNCVECWSPGNTFIRNKANHGSYGFWMGGSDRSVLIGNEAAYNGLPSGNHNAPEPGFGHGGIVFVNGTSYHCIVENNYCHKNNGGGIVIRGDLGSKGEKWRAEHWIVQNNRLENNKWGLYIQFATMVFLGENPSKGNQEPDFLDDVKELTRGVGVAPKPKAVLEGPSKVTAGAPWSLGISRSSDPSGQEPEPQLFADGRPALTVVNQGISGINIRVPIVNDRHSAEPGLHRVSLTVHNGSTADLAWRDLLVLNKIEEEIGTESGAEWGAAFTEEGDRKGKGVFTFSDDPLFGLSSLVFTQDPYPGAYAHMQYPRGLDAVWDWSGKSKLTFWIKAQNPNIPSWQNAGPVITIHTEGGDIGLKPENGGNLLLSPKHSEERWTWMYVEVPLAGGNGWERIGPSNLQHVRGISIGLDSWGYEPFKVWLDGLSVHP